MIRYEGCGKLLNQLCRIFAKIGQCRNRHGRPKVEVQLGREFRGDWQNFSQGETVTSQLQTLSWEIAISQGSTKRGPTSYTHPAFQKHSPLPPQMIKPDPHSSGKQCSPTLQDLHTLRSVSLPYWGGVKEIWRQIQFYSSPFRYRPHPKDPSTCSLHPPPLQLTLLLTLLVRHGLGMALGRHWSFTALYSASLSAVLTTKGFAAFLVLSGFPVIPKLIRMRNPLSCFLLFFLHSFPQLNSPPSMLCTHLAALFLGSILKETRASYTRFATPKLDNSEGG